MKFMKNLIVAVSFLMITEGYVMAEYTRDELKALDIAKEFIAKQYPDYDAKDKELILASEKDVWSIYYKQPSDVAKGSPRIEIDKQKMIIVNAYKSYNPIINTPINYTEDELKALSIGEGFIADKFPDYDIKDKVLAIDSKDDKWIIYYKSAPLTLGSSPVVEVDKKTMDVIKAYKTQ